MKKIDLKSGMIVKTCNDFLYLVLLDTGMDVSNVSDKDVLIGINEDGNIDKYGWIPMSDYNDNLENEDKMWSIKEVLAVRYADKIGRIDSYRSIWCREE